jgi:hypothetical protein
MLVDNARCGIDVGSMLNLDDIGRESQDQRCAAVTLPILRVSIGIDPAQNPLLRPQLPELSPPSDRTTALTTKGTMALRFPRKPIPPFPVQDR